MPAAKLRPVFPSTTTRPRVMYSQPWSPTPSTTAVAPLLRTQNRSPASPRRKTSGGEVFHRRGAAVAHAEPLAREPAQEDLAPGGAVQRDVADDDVLLRCECGGPWGIADDAPAGETLAEVVVGVALDLGRDAGGHPGAEALARRTGELEMDRVVGKTVGVATGDLRGQHRADGSVDVADRQLELDALTPLERRRTAGDELVVERLREAVVLRLDAADRDVRIDVGLVEDLREVDPARLPVIGDVADVE